MNYYLSVGSNVGDRRRNILLALEGLKTLGELQGVSSLYESAPFGVSRQRSFYNMVCTLQSPLRPFRLLRKLKGLEMRIGRQRSYRWGPREIDIDLIDWNGPAVEGPVLTLPHAGMQRRRFVLVPLRELVPDFSNRQAEDIDQLIQRCPDQGSVKRIEPLSI